MYTQIADLIHYLHIILVIYIITGWFITPIKYIYLYLLLIIFVILDWNDFDGQCILTRLEHYFRHKNTESDIEKDKNPEFFRPLIKKLFNIDLTGQQSTRLNYFIFVFSFLLGFLRLLKDYKMKKSVYGSDIGITRKY
jgi:hypothetical protein